jgi:pimeloyl-ACP methyl ester carboxylesterase
MSLAIVRADYFETSAPPLPGDIYKSAKYRIWIPSEVATLRGIIIRQHGCGEGATGYGLSHANDLQWQELARKHQMALLGTELRISEMCAQWYDVNGGSGDALLRGLAQLARDSGHPELATIPWAIFGHSGGGYWATGMLFRHPERMLAQVTRSGSYAFMHWNPAVKKVPVLTTAGIRDLVDNQEYTTALAIKSFRAYRRFDSPWSVAVDPKGDHGNGNGRRLYIPFLDAILALRLPESGDAPREIDTTRGWQGNPDNGEIEPIGKQPRRSWAWFPDEMLARKWQEFVRTGTVIDQTAPPPPHALAVTARDGRRDLTWDACIDLESGLKKFRIYRDGVAIGEVAGQTSNHSDAPEPLQIPFLHEAKEDGQYTVTAVNHDDLESAPSEPLNISAH